MEEHVEDQERVLTFEDAMYIATGCLTYGGGYRQSPVEFEAFKHGITTVCQALTAARDQGVDAGELRIMHRLGDASLRVGTEP
jgi:hypothetical protein